MLRATNGLGLLGYVRVSYWTFSHPIPRMTPQKGGYTTPAPALDLTTPLRGDFLEAPLVPVDRWAPLAPMDS